MPSGLVLNTVYHIRAFAVNMAGVIYGADISFTTLSNAANLPSVTICSQIWTSKNLDVTTYRDGSPIVFVEDPTAWANATYGAWCYYQNDPTNNFSYGKLYNWYAVHDPRGLEIGRAHV